MTRAEEMCANIREELRPEALTLANAVLTLQNKLESQRPVYEDALLAQSVTVGTGETILRSNPVIVEYRQTLDAYTRALKAFNTMFADSDKARIDKNGKITIVGNSKWKKKRTG